MTRWLTTMLAIAACACGPSAGMLAARKSLDSTERLITEVEDRTANAHRAEPTPPPERQALWSVYDSAHDRVEHRLVDAQAAIDIWDDQGLDAPWQSAVRCLGRSLYELQNTLRALTIEAPADLEETAYEQTSGDENACAGR